MVLIIAKCENVHIKNLPEFYRFLRENNTRFIGFRNGFPARVQAQYGRTLDADMKFSNLTFRELLNRITKTKKGGLKLRWMKTINSGAELIDIDI